MSLLHGEAWYIEASSLSKVSDQEIDWDVWNPPKPLPSREETRKKDEEDIERILLDRVLPLLLQTLREAQFRLGKNEALVTSWTDTVRMVRNLEKMFEERKRVQREESAEV